MGHVDRVAYRVDMHVDHVTDCDALPPPRRRA